MDCKKMQNAKMQNKSLKEAIKMRNPKNRVEEENHDK